MNKQDFQISEIEKCNAVSTFIDLCADVYIINVDT